jgi:flagellar basal body-associated protein FliL
MKNDNVNPNKMVPAKKPDKGTLTLIIIGVSAAVIALAAAVGIYAAIKDNDLDDYSNFLF